ncbi:hypothetical protein TgHK011_005894 [Trichoderma gracile]|nr:hypothetical protein TgHK011_005894 [Trichoderma gracile]
MSDSALCLERGIKEAYLGTCTSVGSDGETNYPQTSDSGGGSEQMFDTERLEAGNIQQLLLLMEADRLITLE